MKAKEEARKRASRSRPERRTSEELLRFGDAVRGVLRLESLYVGRTYAQELTKRGGPGLAIHPDGDGNRRTPVRGSTRSG